LTSTVFSWTRTHPRRTNARRRGWGITGDEGRFDLLRLTPSLILLALGVLLVFTGIGSLLIAAWPPRAICTEHDCKEAREWIASSVTLLVLLGGLYQYRRSQLWKRAEFIAGEMKVFFADSDLAGYTPKEVAIRDAYDALLDGLERFSGFLKTGLIASTLFHFFRGKVKDQSVVARLMPLLTET
jgi:hypothetical protein